MRFRLLRRLLAVWLLLLFSDAGVEGAAASGGKTYFAERFDVSITVDSDRSLLVTETIVFRFEGEPFTEVFRRLSRRRTDGIDAIVGAMDGNVLERGRSRGKLEVDRENGIEVVWRFEPSVDQTRTFTLAYRVRGAVSIEGLRDELYWTLLPTRHDYEIRSARIRIDFPRGARLGAEPVVRPPAAVSVQENVVTVDAADLAPDATIVLGLSFEPGSFAAAPPRWQARQLANRRYLPVFLSLAVAVFVAGMAGLIVFRRAHSFASLVADIPEQTVPPDDLPAALAGTLMQSGSRPSWPQAFAALVDLADREVVSIEEVPRRGRFGGQRFQIRLKNDTGNLAPYERQLLEVIFTRRGKREEIVQATDAARRATSKWKHIRRPIERELFNLGPLDPGRHRAARTALRISIVLLVAGALGFIPAALLVGTFGESTLVLPGAVDLLGVAWLIGAVTFPRLSDSGAMRARAWRGFSAYLKNVASGRRAVSDPAVFGRYLSYAAAFGRGPAWVKRFAKEAQGVAAPAWFRAASSSHEAALGALVVFVSRSGSVSAGSGGAHGAGGAGGGGASGAR